MLNSSTRTWIGRIFSTLAALVILGSAITKLIRVPAAVAALTRSGLPETSILPIAILELSCLTLYLIPRTAVLGALLMTGYLGGATVVHVIGRENLAPPLAVGVLVVAGAYLRISELRDLLPFRKRVARSEEEAAVLRTHSQKVA